MTGTIPAPAEAPATPVIECPFPARLNPHVEVGRTHLRQWVRGTGLVARPAARQRFDRADFGRFAAMTYPTADAPTLGLMADWVAWMFLLDDQLDDGLVGRDTEATQQLMADLFAIVHDSSRGDSSRGHSGPPLVRAAADLWRRTAPRASAMWRQRFVEHLAAGGLAAKWEATNRARGVVPDEATYIDRRRHTGAIYVCMDLIDVAEGIDLPPALVDDGLFQRTLDAACDVVCWTNDVYSFDKEDALGEYHNLVALVIHHQGLDRDAAVRQVAARITARTAEFLDGAAGLLTAWPDHQRELTRCLDGMRSWIRGNLDWSRDTRRYRAPAGTELPADYLEDVATSEGVAARPVRRVHAGPGGRDAASSGPVPLPSVAFARRALAPGLREWIDRLDPDLRRACGYQLGLRDAAGAPTGSVTGKFVRPAFVLLSSSAVGGRPLEALAPGLAAELLHNASLVHDDIMDGDTERRHRPTVWAQFGVAQAILVGDALIGLGFEVLSSDRHPCAPVATADLARTFRRVAIGQSRDLRYERLDRVTPRDCLQMLEGKTGEMLRLACRLGARYGGAPERWVDRFGRFGAHLGVAFQLVDDILGIWGDPATTGKPVGADLRRRKKSAPVVAALAAGTAGAAHLRRRYADATELDDAEVALLAEAIEEAGGRTWTWREARRRIDAGWQELAELDLHGPAVGELRCLTDELLDRRC